jgi:Flp pilus assembly protein TadG
MNEKIRSSLPLFPKRKRGQAIIEIGIILLFLIPLVLGALDLGRVIYSHIAVTNAAREGAYYLSNHPDKPGDVWGVVYSEAKNSGIAKADLDGMTVAPSIVSDPNNSDPSNGKPMKIARVQVTVTITGFYFSKSYSIYKTASMMVVR